MKKILFLTLVVLNISLFGAKFQIVTFGSLDGIKITADVYMEHKDKKTPFIVLFHQAGWSRGEYREIAPKLNKLGFNCMAIDQRSGDGVKGVDNETLIAALDKDKGIKYLDAIPDIKAALIYARKHLAKGKLIGWGSSYSAALILKIVGDEPGLADGVLAFSPGEYFKKYGKSKKFVTKSAKNIKVPVFITSAKKEKNQWKKIFDAIASKDKVYFLPSSKGKHGSRALWKKYDDSSAYWKAVETFLQNNFIK